MPQSLMKSSLHSENHKLKIKQEPNKTKSYLPPNLQSFKQKLFSGKGFLVFKIAKMIFNYQLMNHLIKVSL